MEDVGGRAMNQEAHTLEHIHTGTHVCRHHVKPYTHTNTHAHFHIHTHRTYTYSLTQTGVDRLGSLWSLR